MSQILQGSSGFCGKYERANGSFDDFDEKH